MEFTPRIDKAIRASAYAHANQRRKGTEIPYAVHPFAVMLIATEATSDEDTLVACLLHDTLEDAPERYGYNDILKDFGKNVLSIVKGVTKNGDLPSWQERADAYLEHLVVAEQKSLVVCAADKIHNLQSILTDYEAVGEELWDRFNSGKEQQLWWYESVYRVVNMRIPESPLTSQLGDLVARLKHIVESA